MVVEDCPLCNNKLKVITDESNYVIDYWCSSCGNSFSLEDLEIIKIKKVTMDKWL